MSLWRRRPLEHALEPAVPAGVQADGGASPSFAVVDVETTGLWPGGHDRVVEIAVLRVEPSGQVTDELTTLVNPQRDIGPTHIHGVRTAAVLDAPSFADIAGDVLQMIDGAVLVGHNLRFDWSFLRSELARSGIDVEPWPGICTLELAGRYHRGPGRRLPQCCAEVGITIDGWHSAAADVQATRALFFAYWAQAQNEGCDDLVGLGCRPTEWPPLGARPQPTGRRHSREAAAVAPRRNTFLADLVGRLPNDPSLPGEVTAYLEILDRTLEDRRISPDEAEALAGVAADWGLTRQTVSDAHRSYVRSLASVAYADGVLSDVERDDLVEVASLLDLTADDLDDAILQAVERIGVPAPTAIGPTFAPGSTVCFTGALLGTIAGEPITRTRAQEFAAAAGLVNAKGVSKTLDVLVIADPDSQSGKARKAREYGTRIVAEAAFWNAIGVSTD